jgi:hypothetical protein
MLLAAAFPEATRSLLRTARSGSPRAALRTAWPVSPDIVRRGLRSRSLASVLHDAERLARRPSRLALGAAATVLATAAVLAGVTAGPAAPAAAVSDQDAAGESVPAAAGRAVPAVPAAGGSASQAAASQAPAGRTTPAAVPAARVHAARAHAARARAAESHRPAHRARAAAAGHAAASVPAKPYLIYDSVIPAAIPSAQKSVATYATGPFAVPSSQVTGRRAVLWIDTRGYDFEASVLDVEPGDATPAVAASWAWHRLKAHPNGVARIYTMINEWPAVQAAVASFPARMRSRIHWWIANPTGTPHLVPGSDATQWYWGSHYDITTAAPGF